jgi:proteasome lid subunit RPN8/RPN11
VSLTLTPAQRAEIDAALERAYPEEGCGVLIGREREGAREVVEVLAFENRRADSRGNRYLIAPEQVLAAERRARDLGLDVIAFYHSHPDHPARPSAFDLEHAWPWYDYLIVGVEHGRARVATAWRLREDRSAFDETPVQVEAGADPGDSPR